MIHDFIHGVKSPEAEMAPDASASGLFVKDLG